MKDPAAVSLGRKGGEARAKVLTQEQMRDIASRAANARWYKKEEPMPNNGGVGYKYRWSAMKIGDCFSIPLGTQPHSVIQSGVAWFRRNQNIHTRFVFHKMDDAYYIWRINPEEKPEPTMHYEIIKGKPIPNFNTRSSKTRMLTAGWPLDKMEMGDSIRVFDAPQDPAERSRLVNSAGVTARKWGHANGEKKFAVRFHEDGIWLWRIQ